MLWEYRCLYQYNEEEINIFCKYFRFHCVLEIANQNVIIGVHNGLSLSMDSKKQLADVPILILLSPMKQMNSILTL